MDSFAEAIYRVLTDLSQTREEVETIVIPNGRRRLPYEEFIRHYNLPISSSYTISQMRSRIREILSQEGYSNSPGGGPDIYQRKRRIPAQLPNRIPLSTFQSPEQMVNFINDYSLERYTDVGLNQYLIEQGYFYSPLEQALIRSSSSEPVGKSLADLITNDTIIQTISSPDMITLRQEDIRALCIDRFALQKLIDGSQTLDQLFERLHIDPGAGKVILIAFLLPTLSTSRLHGISQMNSPLKDIRKKLLEKISLQPRTYPQRDQFPNQDQIPFDLELALLEGFDISQNSNLLAKLATLVNLRTKGKYVLYWASLLRLYPDLAKGFFHLIGETRALVSQSTASLFYENMNRVEEIYFYLVGYPLILQENIVRKKNLESLPAIYARVLVQIYQTRDIREILDQEQSPLEPYLFAVRGIQPNQIRIFAPQVGMKIPSNVDNPRNYFLDNLARYGDVVGRAPNVPPLEDVLTANIQTIEEFAEAVAIYTDQELIDGASYDGTYNSRTTLIKRIYDLREGDHFFLLNRLRESRTINTETMLLEMLTELPTPYLAYGNIFRYRIYSFEELNTAWHEEGEVLNFRHPENPNQNFTIEDLDSFRIVAPSVMEQNNQLSEIVIRLLDKIDRGIVLRGNHDRQTDDFKNFLSRASESLRDKAKGLFMKIFYTGMYMRRWKGPGNPYPHLEEETLERFDPEPQTVLLLAQISETLEELRQTSESREFLWLFNELRTIRIEADSYSYIPERLINILTTSAEGTYCIRMASLGLVLSGYFYSLTFFQTRLPNVFFSRMVPIQ